MSSTAATTASHQGTIGNADHVACLTAAWEAARLHLEWSHVDAPVLDHLLQAAAEAPAPAVVDEPEVAVMKHQSASNAARLVGVLDSSPGHVALHAKLADVPGPAACGRSADRRHGSSCLGSGALRLQPQRERVAGVGETSNCRRSRSIRTHCETRAPPTPLSS